MLPGCLYNALEAVIAVPAEIAGVASIEASGHMFAFLAENFAVYVLVLSYVKVAVSLSEAKTSPTYQPKNLPLP